MAGGCGKKPGQAEQMVPNEALQLGNRACCSYSESTPQGAGWEAAFPSHCEFFGTQGQQFTNLTVLTGLRLGLVLVSCLLQGHEPGEALSGVQMPVSGLMVIGFPRPFFFLIRHSPSLMSGYVHACSHRLTHDCEHANTCIPLFTLVHVLAWS